MQKTTSPSNASSPVHLPKKEATEQPLILTGGDPAGISPEITENLIPHLRKDGVAAVLFATGSAAHIESLLKSDSPDWRVSFVSESSALNDDFSSPGLRIADLSAGHSVFTEIGKPSAEGGWLAFRALKNAAERIQKKGTSGLITAPLSKYYVNLNVPDFTGHTGFLAEFFGSEVLMLMHGKEFSVIPVTVHTALKNVPVLLKQELNKPGFKQTLRLLQKTEVFRYSRWAITALNPHAGEEGLMGTEEIDYLNQAAENLRSHGFPVDGPLPADGAFMDGIRQKYRLFLTAYHDQGLIPFKALEGKSGVNATIGLPFLRLSPDHGTAYSVAGKGLADPSSMIRCFEIWRNGELKNRE